MGHARSTIPLRRNKPAFALTRIQSAGLVFSGIGYPRALKSAGMALVCPMCMSRPELMRMRLSNETKRRDDGWWIVKRTVLPALATLSRSCKTVRAATESSPLVGSSRKIVEGLVTSSTPTLVRRLSPAGVVGGRRKGEAVSTCTTHSIFSLSKCPFRALTYHRRCLS